MNTISMPYKEISGISAALVFVSAYLNNYALFCLLQSNISFFFKMTALHLGDREKLTGIVVSLFFVHLILVSNLLIHE